MKLLIKIILLSFIFSFSVFTELNAQKKVVVIDAGHGGKDPGALGRVSKEKEVALKIALKVGKYLEQNVKNIKIIYTRKTDVFIELDKRAEIANKNKAVLFVSIHANSLKNKNFYGTETYVMGLHKSDDNLEVAIKENSAVLFEENYKKKYAGYEPDSPETYIVMNLFQNAYLDMSLNLAEKIQKQFKDRANRKDLGVKQAGFFVLWKTTMPSVLIEVGFMSNRNEEIYLNSEYGQEIIASAIYRAVRDYLNEL